LSTPEPRVLVLDRTPELAARIRHNAVGAGAVVKACADVLRAETLLTTAAWDVLVAGPSQMHRAGLRRLGAIHERIRTGSRCWPRPAAGAAARRAFDIAPLVPGTSPLSAVKWSPRAMRVAANPADKK
jgi:hypothetical protein